MLKKLTSRLRQRQAGWSRKDGNSLQLGELRRHIIATIKEVEGVFQGISGNLEALDEKTRRLRQDCQVLLDAAGGQNESTQLLFRVAQALEQPMSYLNSLLGNQERYLQLMLSSQRSAGDLLKLQNEMVSALEPLKFMLVFFKIEASHLSEENRQTFHSVSEEISQLHVLVDETFQKNLTNLRDARAAIVAAEKKSKNERAAQSIVFAKKQAEITNAIANLKQQFEVNSHRSSDLDDSANAFEQAVGRLVMSLQYEDIVRQRCESILQTSKDKPDGISTASWHIVLATQIETAAEELRQSTQELDTGLNAISLQAKELYQTSSTMEQFEHITTSADGLVQMLLEALEDVQTMLAQSTRLSKDSRDCIQPVQNLTKELSALVFEVSIKIQFIALNAQVRSIQVGEGSGLEVLAARTADISTELRGLGVGTEQLIETLHAAIVELVKTIDDEWILGTEQLKQIQKDSPALESDLHNLRDSTLSSLEIIANLSALVESFSNGDAERLERLISQAQTLDDFARELRSQAKLDKLRPKQRQAIEDEVNSLLSETRGAMHTRIHTGDHEAAKNFDLGISARLENRANSSKSLTCDNIDLF